MQHLFVVHTSPRIIVVDVDAPYLRMRYISAHAPIAKNYDARANFFKSLSKYVTHKYPLMLFIDANARPEDGIGGAKSGSNSQLRDASLQFYDFLDVNDLITTNQMGAFTQATSNTWTSHSTNIKHTLDYVAVKTPDSPNVQCAATLPSVDNGHMLQDHVPNAATYAFKASAEHFQPNCIRARVTKAQVRDPENRAAFASALAQIPATDWQLPVDEHYKQLADAIFHAIQKSFPPAKLVAKKPYLSGETLLKVAENRSLKQQLRYLRKFRAAGDFSNVPANLVISAIEQGQHYLKLLNQHISKLSANDLFQYILQMAEKLNLASLKVQPDEAWKILKRLIAISPGNKYSPDRGLPHLFDHIMQPVSTVSYTHLRAHET